jgi:hypothetical protein
MRRILIVLLSMALLLVGAVFYFTGSGQPPTSQPPLVEITSSTLTALQSEFNHGSSELRIILLLSPT